MYPIIQSNTIYSVTPSDTELLPKFPVILSVETTAGNVKVSPIGADPDEESEAIILHFEKGFERPIQVQKVWLSDTTAEGILAHYVKGI